MNKIFQSVLNIAAGKFAPLDLDQSTHYHVLNVDTMYYLANTPEKGEEKMRGRELRLYGLVDEGAPEDEGAFRAR